MICQHCGNPLPKGAKFCSICGQPQAQLTCNNCGNPLEPNIPHFVAIAEHQLLTQ